jgi:restriction endonuclease S subunit
MPPVYSRGSDTNARWEWLPLFKVTTSYQGLLLSRYQDEAEPEYPIINVRNLEQLEVGGEMTTAQVKIPNPEYEILPGDVLVTLRGTSLKSSVATSSVQGSLAGQNLAVLRPNSRINSLYLATLLRSQWFQRKLSTEYVQSTGTQLLTLSKLRNLEIPLPDMQTQHQLAELAIATERATQAVQETIAARERVAEATIASVLEGKIRV